MRRGSSRTLGRQANVTEDGRMHGRPENSAAVVNGLLVLLLPLAFLVLGSIVFDSDSDTSVTVRAPGSSGIARAVVILVQIGLVLLPFAALAGWRTWVYAKGWREQRVRGWQAVAEAGACGLVVALGYLAPGIVTRPTEAPPYVIVYGGAALILGLMVGLFLRMTAILVLKFHKSAAA